MSSKYDNIMLIGVLNPEPTDNVVSYFCKINNLANLIKDKTCFINPSKPTCINLILFWSKFFQNAKFIQAGLWDFHNMSVKVTRWYCNKVNKETICMTANNLTVFMTAPTLLQLNSHPTGKVSFKFVVAISWSISIYFSQIK